MLLVSGPPGPEVSAQDLTEDEEAESVDEDVVDDVIAEDEDDEAEVEDDENVELVSESFRRDHRVCSFCSRSFIHRTIKNETN